MAKPKRTKNGWSIAFKWEGRRHRRKFRDDQHPDSYRAALEYEQSVKVAPVKNSKHQLPLLVQEYLSYCERTGKKKISTLKTDRNRFKLVLTWADSEDLRGPTQLTVEAIRRFQDYFYTRNTFYRYSVSPRSRNATWNRYRNTLSAFLNWCIERGYISNNPITGRKEFRAKEQQHEIRFFTQSELQIIFDALDLHEDLWSQAFFRLLAYSGLRLSEAMRLQWRHISIERNVITVTIDTKNNKTRIVPLYSRLTPYLQSLPTKHGLVFADSRGHRIRSDNSWEWRCRRLMSKLTIPYGTLHAFRHTFCTLSLYAGIPITQVKDWAGHSDIRTTMRYLHLLPDQFNSLERVSFEMPAKRPIPTPTALDSAFTDSQNN